MMLGELHHNLVCRGKCPLADAKFHEEIFQVAKLAAEDALSSLGKHNISIVSEASANTFGKIDLFDRYLASNNNTSVWMSTADRVDVPSGGDLISALISALKKRLLESGESGKYGPEVHLLLWFVVKYGPNCDFLAEILKDTGDKVPACLLSSLLVGLCRNYRTSPLAVQILLKYGASPSEHLCRHDKSSQPITACLNGLSLYLEQEQDPIEVTRHIDVLKLLLDCYKSRNLDYRPFFAPDPNAQFWIMRFMALLSLYKPEMVTTIIEAGTAYLNMEHERQCALSNCIMNILPYLNVRTESFSIETATTMVRHAALPLLRAGCRIRRPVFSLFQGRNFGRFPGLIDFVVESHSNAFPFDPNKLRLDEQSVQAVERRFPRKLQLQARQAILSRLQLGLKRRRDAIESLPIPQSLQDFLNFPEFDALSFQ